MSSSASFPSIVIIVCSLLFCSARTYAETSGPHTTFSDELGYKTVGSLDLDAPCEKAREVLSDCARYEDWLLDGLTKNDRESRRLPVALNRLEYDSEKEILTVFFSFNMIFLRNIEYSLPFLIKKLSDGNGIELVAAPGGRAEKYIARLEYAIRVQQSSVGSSLDYSGECKFKGLAAKLFTLRLYKKNIEWYIYRFAANFTKKLQSYSD